MQRFFIRESPSGVVLAQKAVDFFPPPPASIALNPSFQKIMTVRIEVVERPASFEITLFTLSARIVGTNLVLANLTGELLVTSTVSPFPTVNIPLALDGGPTVLVTTFTNAGTGGMPSGDFTIELRLADSTSTGVVTGPGSAFVALAQ